MDSTTDLDAAGLFDARYLAFLETISQLRPRLHRYCARMTGSVLDGEDIVQEALFQAYRMLDSYDDRRPLTPWLFRIAHNRCIDFLRRRAVQERTEGVSAQPDAILPEDPPGRAVHRAVEHLVGALPPKERACVLLKDVLDYRLEEIAELVDSTVGGVKAALSRGRSKLAAVGAPSPSRRTATAEGSQLLHRYVDCFNRRDWDGLRELVSADARIRVADRFAGRLTDSPYMGRYERWVVPWRLTVGELEGEPVVVILCRDADHWSARGVVQLQIADNRIVRIADYLHCPWILTAAASSVLPDVS